MAKQLKRVQRTTMLTPEEAGRDREARRQLQEEFPPKKRVGMGPSIEIGSIMIALKDARTSQGMTLQEAAKRANIEPPNLSTLENSPDANPTLQTLMRYAGALGKSIRIVIEDA
jgi:DNA-binding XRE family transcriptional regulator